MARTSSIFKANELKRALANAKLRVKGQQGKSNKKAIKRAKAAGLNLNVFTSRVHNRCRRCGRGRAYLRKFAHLQAQWARLGPVPADIAGPLNERFQRACRRFSDLRRRAS